jgi:four helix bundle protein
MHRYQDLQVWQKAVDLAVKIYKTAKDFPTEEKYILISQIKKSAISIPSNIAEGAGRNGKKDFSNFLGIALASSFELQTQLIIAEKLNYLCGQDLQHLESELEHVQNMIVKLIKSLKIN